VSKIFISYTDVKLKEATAARPAQSQARQRRRRADAEQNVAAILHAATKVLSAQPEGSVEDIARAAGVSRQTVYAHFPSREALLDAVVERATAEVMAAFEAAGLEEAPPAEALIRLLDAGWTVSARYPFLWHLPAVSPDRDLDRHGPVVDRLHELIRRGQESGDFDRRLSPGWLLAAALALGRAAEDEVKAGRMTIEDATSAVHHSMLRLFGLQDPAPADDGAGAAT
jgi:AcrR family transcriptional regulator